MIWAGFTTVLLRPEERHSRAFTERRCQHPQKQTGLLERDRRLSTTRPASNALLGCVEEAITCLERGADEGLAERGWYEHDSNLDPLRDHSRFQQLLQRTR
jgi:hypothetical protein